MGRAMGIVYYTGSVSVSSMFDNDMREREARSESESEREGERGRKEGKGKEKKGRETYSIQFFHPFAAHSSAAIARPLVNITGVM